MTSMPSADWNELSARVAAQFHALSNDAALVERALDNLRDWLHEPIYEQHRPYLMAHIEQDQCPLLLEATHQYVPFGTGGRRGRVGYGPNRINEVTVSLSVQGHCKFLQDQSPSGETAIVVACDTRIFQDLAGNYSFLPEGHPVLGQTSVALARRAAEIYAGNGIVSYLPGGEGTGYLTTPELSYLIRYLKAAGGVNMSASHNHPDDNGFKFFNAEGGQETPPLDEKLAGYMDGVRELHWMDFAEGVKQGLIRAIPVATHRTYIDLNLALTPHRSEGEFPVVYTPLCGTGDTTVGDLLREAGYKVLLYGPHANNDGTFANVPSRLPNPENPDAATPAIAAADADGSTLVLSTDPDADRLGVYAKSRAGDWKYFTGNDIASVLAYYLVLDDKIGYRKKGLLIKTLVTSRTLDNISRRGDCQIVSDLLVGFKYIAEVLGSLEKTGEFDGVTGAATDLVMAGEESHGLLFTPEIRDKDAAAAALLLCELASKLAAAGDEALPEYLDRVVLECGNFVNVSRSIVLRGIAGTVAMGKMMESLRNNPPATLGGYNVTERRDFLSTTEFGEYKSKTDKSARNLLLFRMDAGQVVIRPSGTEPKVKIYTDVEGSKLVAKGDRKGAEALARKLASDVYDECIGRIGASLSESAKLLPDYVDLDLKKAFDSEFAGDLLEAADRLAGLTGEGCLDWIRERMKAYGAGADPIATVSAAVAHVAGVLAAENPAKGEGLERLRQML